MRTLITTATVMVLVLTMGLHWALLQTVAWTGMVIAYSQKNPFPDAVSMTFDGEHLCPMCKAIKQGRAEEKQQEQIAAATKLPLAVIWQAPLFCFEVDHQLIPPINSTFSTRSEAPPKPRPKPFPSFSLV
jgi:hypothetical protein